ncbi:MAG TPA: hypothetical protein PK706_25775, partial [Xanthobacteraceae bacterium]|nr:hypothetical protein [Xanthobacteraceae bacterium]
MNPIDPIPDFMAARPAGQRRGVPRSRRSSIANRTSGGRLPAGRFRIQGRAKCAAFARSVGVDARGFDHRLPFGDFRRQELLVV